MNRIKQLCTPLKSTKQTDYEIRLDSQNNIIRVYIIRGSYGMETLKDEVIIFLNFFF